MRMLTVITLATLSGLTIADEAASQKLNALLEKTTSISAHFEQNTLDPKGKSLQKIMGEMQVKRPNLFRWDTTHPFEQHIIANGEVVWVYDPELQQATKQKLDKQVANTPALLLSGDSKKIATFILKPKAKETVFESLRVSFNGSTLNSMQLKDSLGQKTDIVFSQVQVNGKIAPSLFQFTPPKDVDVIDE